MSSNISVVTFLFDYEKLTGTKYNRVSEEAFFKHGAKLLSIDMPMYIFADEKYINKIKSLRNPNYDTKIIPFDISTYPYFEHSNDIKKMYINGEFGNLCGPRDYSVLDSNDTKFNQRFLIMMSWCKIYAIRKALEINEFNSKIFTWVDFGIFKLNGGSHTISGISNVLHNPHTEKIKMIVIKDFSPKSVKNRYEYYKYNRWTCIAGLFSIPAHLFIKFEFLFNEEYKFMIKNKIPSYEEQIFSVIIAENREIFDIYYGDYKDIFTSYFEHKSGYYITYSNALHMRTQQNKNIILFANILIDSYNKNVIQYSKQEICTIFDELLIGTWYAGDLLLSKRCADIVHESIKVIDKNFTKFLQIKNNLSFHNINI